MHTCLQSTGMNATLHGAKQTLATLTNRPVPHLNQANTQNAHTLPGCAGTLQKTYTTHTRQPSTGVTRGPWWAAVSPTLKKQSSLVLKTQTQAHSSPNTSHTCTKHPHTVGSTCGAAVLAGRVCPSQGAKRGLTSSKTSREGRSHLSGGALLHHSCSPGGGGHVGHRDACRRHLPVVTKGSERPTWRAESEAEATWTGAGPQRRTAAHTGSTAHSCCCCSFPDPTTP